MKKRNIMAVIVFSIITAGIYDLFWLASVKKELNQKAKTHVPSLWVLFAPVLAIIAMLIALVAVAASQATTNADGTVSTSSGAVNAIVLLLYAVVLLFIIPVTFYWFFKFSKAVNEYTNGELSTAMTFILIWILRFIGMAIIQDKFNEMVDAGSNNNGNAPAVATIPSAPASNGGFGEQTPPTGTPQPPVVPPSTPLPPQTPAA